MAGRPTVLTPVVLQALVDARWRGKTVAGAAREAGVSLRTAHRGLALARERGMQATEPAYWREGWFARERRAGRARSLAAW